MSLPLLDAIRGSGGGIALFICVTLGVAGCLQDNTIYENWPIVCESDAECASCRPARD